MAEQIPLTALMLLQHDYKSFSPNTDYDNVDWESAPAIQEPNVTSAICEPENNTAVSTSEGTIPVKGFAYRYASPPSEPSSFSVNCTCLPTTVRPTPSPCM